MTPLTWSFLQIYAEETFGNPLPGDNPLMGNISGRFYINLSLYVSVFQTLGFSRERMNKESEELFGNLPENIDIPTIPFSRLAVLRKFAPFAVRAMVRRRRNLRQLGEYTRALPERIAALQLAIEYCPTPEILAHFWPAELEPVLRKTYQMLQTGTSKYENAYRPLLHELADQVGEADANLLLSGVSDEGERLASLGPLVGLWQVAQGDLSRKDYFQQYGHRGPHEFELAWTRPAEDPDWMDAQLATLEEEDVQALLDQRKTEKRAAWQRYIDQFPGEAEAKQRKLDKVAAAARDREAIRSEVTRLMGVVRAYALRTGELTRLGDDVFYLTARNC
jgi:pyruvate,water dikinase